MSASQVVRLRNGETLAVRTGILRGAGPQGPPGPPGATGPRGLQGEQGPMGEVSEISFRLGSTASQTVSFDSWYDLALETVVEDAGLLEDQPDAYRFQVTQSGHVLVQARVKFAKPTNTNATGTRQVRLVDNVGAELGQVSLPAVPADDTVVPFSVILPLDETKTYRLQAKSRDAAAINTTGRSLEVAKIGAGPIGPAGPVGPAGQTGPAGPAGPQGEASAGFSTFDALAGGANSETYTSAPADLVGDQEIPVPDGTASPRVPYYLRAFALAITRRVNGLFDSAADRDALRPDRQIGEIYTLRDTGAAHFVEKNDTETLLARAVVSTSTPPTGAGQAAPGVFWVQV